MKLRQIGITVARTFNLGNYESFRTEASALVEIEESDDIAAARERALEEVRASLTAAYAGFKPKKGANG